jgi:hypothetical protein
VYANVKTQAPVIATSGPIRVKFPESNKEKMNRDSEGGVSPKNVIEIIVKPGPYGILIYQRLRRFLMQLKT